MALALIHASRKLLQYFQAHTVYVLTKYPLQALLKRSNFTRRIAKWGMRLESFDIKYKPRSIIKGQVLVDFIVEFTPSVNDAHRVYQVLVRPWKIYVNAAANARGAEIGIVLESPKGLKIEHSLRLGFQASNNEVEYEALVVRLWAVKVGATNVEVFLDSCLVINQVSGSFEARDLRMADYLKLVCSFLVHIRSVRLVQIPREENNHANSLGTLASSMMDSIPQIISVELLELPSIDHRECLQIAAITISLSWMVWAQRTIF